MVRRGLTIVVAAGLLCLAPIASPAEPVPFKVIANNSVPGKRIPKQVLADIFLRKVARWSDGAAIAPVDLQLTAPPRLDFIRSVLGLSTLEVQQYWRHQMSRGNLPPPVKKTEEALIEFVAASPGAIGYVAEATATPETVKVLAVE